MKNLIANITGGYASSASVVDNNLIISLPNAKNPVVWRMDIGKVKTSSLEIRTDKDGSSVLTFKTEKGEQEDIAPFDNRTQAVKALMTISSAMQNADAHAPRVAANAAPAAQAATVSQTGGKGKLMGSIIGVGVLCLLIYVLLTMSPSRPVATNSSSDQQSSFSGTAEPLGETGVPQSADSFLMGR